MIAPRISGYKVTTRIHESSTTVSWRAVQTSLGRDVVVCQMKREASDIEKKGFETIAKAVFKISHPSIPRILDIGRIDDRPYFIRDWMEGEYLASMVKNGRRLPVETVAKIGRDLADILDAAWKQGNIVHRNLKPTEIVVSPEGDAKISRFISATVITPGVDPLEFDNGMVVGTPYFMAPEQAQGSHDIDFHADMYGLGALLYLLCTGKKPFEEESDMMQVMQDQINGKLPSPMALNNGIPRSLERIIVRLMMKNPRKRYDWWQDAVADFSRVLKGAEVEEPSKDDESTIARFAGAAAGEVAAENRDSRDGRTEVALTPVKKPMAKPRLPGEDRGSGESASVKKNAGMHSAVSPEAIAKAQRQRQAHKAVSVALPEQVADEDAWEDRMEDGEETPGWAAAEKASQRKLIPQNDPRFASKPGAAGGKHNSVTEKYFKKRFPPDIVRNALWLATIAGMCYVGYMRWNEAEEPEGASSGDKIEQGQQQAMRTAGDAQSHGAGAAAVGEAMSFGDDDGGASEAPGEQTGEKNAASPSSAPSGDAPAAPQANVARAKYRAVAKAMADGNFAEARKLLASTTGLDETSKLECGRALELMKMVHSLDDAVGVTIINNYRGKKVSLSYRGKEMKIYPKGYGAGFLMYTVENPEKEGVKSYSAKLADIPAADRLRLLYREGSDTATRKVEVAAAALALASKDRRQLARLSERLPGLRPILEEGAK